MEIASIVFIHQAAGCYSACALVLLLLLYWMDVIQPVHWSCYYYYIGWI